ncbi:MAG TPA: hypothetical protein VM165_25645 [Planctomycetaceae bacterium]|nr:hypothetical protein [Planctomycetaceae bacterium]
MAVVVWLLAAAPAFAAEPTDVSWSVGWDGVVKLGRWSVAAAEFTLTEPAECRLECTAPDGDGHSVRFLGPTTKLTAGRQRIETPFQIGRPDGSVTLRLRRDGAEVAQTMQRSETDGGLQLAPLSDRLIVTLGEVRSVTALATTPLRRHVHLSTRVAAAELPGSVAAYAAVDWLLLTGSAAVSELQSAAIRDWVRDGGRLIVSVPKTMTEFQSSPLTAWLPVKVATEPVVVRDLGALEAFAGRNLRIPMTGGVKVADLNAPDGVVLASSRNEELLVRVPYGFGEVVVLALDVTQAPLVNWGGMNDFVRRLVELEPAATGDEKSSDRNVRGQLTSTGISDLASQLGASLDRFPEVRRPSPWWSMVWLLGCLLVVGPLDYVLVHRVLQRPHYTWVTLPVWLVLFAGLAASAGGGWNRTTARLNQMDVVDIDEATQSVHVNSYATFYSPVSQRVDLTAAPRVADWSAVAANSALSRGLSWFYIPESTTGGLYRPGGVEWGRTEYQIEPLSGQMTSVPVLQWSSKTIASSWSDTARNAVESDLQSTGLGRLTGTLTHYLPGRITDWVLAYGNRAYQLQVSRTDDTIQPLPAGRRLSAEDPLLFQGDLRSLLTRVVTTRETGMTSKDMRVHLEQTKYDPLARDPHRLWQMVTFHKAAGGTGYSRLDNELLLDSDLTRQLELGRAVLFGRLDAASWVETRVNGEELPPDRSDVFVRLVLPVRRSGEIVRELPKFGPDQK